MKAKSMKIESPRFGTLDVAPDKIIEFPLGLVGFEDCRQFTLFHQEEGEPKYFILQSLDAPEVAFHITDPAHFGYEFHIALSEEERGALNLPGPDGAAIAVILLKDADGAPLRANRNAPLLINLAGRRGIQHVLTPDERDALGE